MDPQPATPQPPKRTRTLTPEILKNLEKAREKAREKRLQIGEIGRMKKQIREQTFKDESVKVKEEFERMKSPLNPAPAPVSVPVPEQDDTDDEEVVVKKKSKKKKKPIVIVEESDTESEDEQVVYIKRASKKPKHILEEEPLIPETPRSIYSGMMNANLFRRRY